MVQGEEEGVQRGLSMVYKHRDAQTRGIDRDAQTGGTEPLTKEVTCLGVTPHLDLPGRSIPQPGELALNTPHPPGSVGRGKWRVGLSQGF